MTSIKQTPQIAVSEISIPDVDGSHQGGRATKCENTHDDNEHFLVEFSPEDPEDPKNWSAKLKWGVTLGLSAQGFNRILISTIMAPAITTIAGDLNMTAVESTMSLSVYLLATAFGPLVIGPMSEIYGRKHVIHITNIWLLICNLVCGFANTKGLLIAFRLLAGFGASAVYTVAYAVLGDVWPPEQRGASLSLYLLIPLTGAAIGPIIRGFVVEYSTWRWIFWATTIFQTVAELVTLPMIRETYAPLLLHRRARKLREQTADPRYYTLAELRDQGWSAAAKLHNSLTRPLRLLAFHPIIQMQSLLGGINYGLLYFALASFSNLFIDAYEESISISGLHYLAIAVREVLGARLCGPLMDYAYRTLTVRADNISAPELRIPLLLPSVLLTPLGFLLYGWAARYRLHWVAVDVGAAMLAMGMQVFDTTLRVCVMDAYPDHVSSVSAATQFLKSMLAFAFPLFANQMYGTIGYGWGNGLLALLSLGIALPSTGILWRYGAKLRAKQSDSY